MRTYRIDARRALEQLAIERAVLGRVLVGVKFGNDADGGCATLLKHVPPAVRCPGSTKGGSAYPFFGRSAERVTLHTPITPDRRPTGRAAPSFVPVSTDTSN